jgi:hypothetical protein
LDGGGGGKAAQISKVPLPVEAKAHTLIKRLVPGVNPDIVNSGIKPGPVLSSQPTSNNELQLPVYAAITASTIVPAVVFKMIVPPAGITALNHTSSLTVTRQGAPDTPEVTVAFTVVPLTEVQALLALGNDIALHGLSFAGI